MLNYEEFKQAVADNIKEYLPAKYEESHVEVKEVIKNNNTVLDGLLVSSPDSNVSPAIYLNDYYEQYKNGMESMQKLSDALGVTLGYCFSPNEEKKEVTAEMQQTMILMEELDPKMQNRILGYVQSIAQLEKEKRED